MFPDTKTLVKKYPIRFDVSTMIKKLLILLVLSGIVSFDSWAQGGGGGDKVGNGTDDVEVLMYLQQASQYKLRNCDFEYIPTYKVCETLSRIKLLNYEQLTAWENCCD